jgi:hypothetical protein
MRSQPAGPQPTTLYHCARRAHRESILAHGLHMDPRTTLGLRVSTRRVQDPAVFAAGTILTAWVGWGHWSHGGTADDWDLWRIDLNDSGLPVEFDPWTDDSWAIVDNVPPSLLTLISDAEALALAEHRNLRTP